MNNNKDLLTTCRDLEFGQTIEARWTNCGSYYRATATVTKINKKSLKAELVEAVGPYPAGFVVTLPRVWNRTWSPNNCAAPAGEVA